MDRDIRKLEDWQRGYSLEDYSNKKTQMITKSRLKSERGCTDKLLKNFLPIPDLTKPNPNYISGPPMLLFDIDRVKKIEQTDEFKTQYDNTKKRKAAAKNAVETKLQKLWCWLNTVKINVPVFNKSKLIKNACNHYNDIQEDREFEGLSTCGIKATTDSDPKFIERICVNYLRHCLTKYEEHLDRISGKVGFTEGYDEIRRKIFIEISKKYQWLADECNRQQKREIRE